MFDNAMYIEVLGDYAETKAKAIASHYGTECAKMEDGTYAVKCNDELEQAFCMDEDIFIESLDEVAAATGIRIDPNDIAF